MDAGERLALYSLGLNLTLVGVKYFLGVFSGSLALLADAVHSLADVISSASVWIGIRMSRRQSKRFPYGLYKVENLVALVTALLIMAAGVEIIQGAFGRHQQLLIGRLPPAIGGVILIALVLWSFSRFELKKAKALASPSLGADARHILTDLCSSCLILIALAAAYLQIRFPLDRIAALLIAILVGWVGLRIAVDAIRVLLDASLDFDTLSAIREIILGFPQVSKVIALRGRNSGRFKFIEVEVALRLRELARAHLVAEQMETQIKATVPNVDHIVIHYEPVTKETVVYAIPVALDKMTLSAHFGEAPYFFLLRLRNNNQELLEERFLSNPFKDAASGKGIKVAEWLIGLGVDKVISHKSFDHKGPHYVFSTAGVIMQQTDLTLLNEIKEKIVTAKATSMG